MPRSLHRGSQRSASKVGCNGLIAPSEAAQRSRSFSSRDSVMPMNATLTVAFSCIVGEKALQSISIPEVSFLIFRARSRTADIWRFFFARRIDKLNDDSLPRSRRNNNFALKRKLGTERREVPTYTVPTRYWKSADVIYGPWRGKKKKLCRDDISKSPTVTSSVEGVLKLVFFLILLRILCVS